MNINTRGDRFERLNDIDPGLVTFALLSDGFQTFCHERSKVKKFIVTAIRRNLRHDLSGSPVAVTEP